MNEHGKKMVAPIIITILMVVYIIGCSLVCLLLDFPWWIAACGVGVGVVAAGLMIGVLISRIKEITSGEEDDLSNY